MGQNPMADTTSGDRQDTHPHKSVGMLVQLVHGHASPEELSALIATVVVLTAAGSDDPCQDKRPWSGSGMHPRFTWNSPARMVRVTHSHGPGGWRASAYPR